MKIPRLFQYFIYNISFLYMQLLLFLRGKYSYYILQRCCLIYKLHPKDYFLYRQLRYNH
jgi:hypothetical protein